MRFISSSFAGKGLAIALATFMLAACSAAPKRDADRFYGLNVEAIQQSYGSTAQIEVRPVTIKGVQSGRPLVIQESAAPLQLVESRGHFWHSQPAYLIQDSTIEALNQGTTDARFGTSDTLKMIDYRLRLTATQFSYMPSSHAMVAITMSLQTRSGEVITAGNYEAKAELTSDAPADATAAFGTAMEMILTDMAADIAEAL